LCEFIIQQNYSKNPLRRNKIFPHFWRTFRGFLCYTKHKNYIQGKGKQRMIKILLMEDDLNLCQSIQQALKKEGYSVDCCNDGESAMIYALNTDYGYDLAIVDRMLPIIDGLTIIKAMRRKQIQIPVIIITGMSALDDRVDGLDSGADDYLIKPFHIRELMARVRALTRRPQQIQEMGMLSYADLHFDYPNRKVTCNGQELILTAKETELLSVLMKQPETSFSREQLVLKVWGSNADIEPGNLDNYISFLRKRLRELHSKCAITTIYGSGYRLESAHA
jgi:two-component system response regulator ArlR